MQQKSRLTRSVAPDIRVERTVMNLIAAFVTAPFLGVLVSALVVTPFFGEFRGWGLYFGFGLFVAYPSAFFVGLPLYLLAKRCLAALRFWQFVLGGIVSAVPGLYLLLAPFSGLYFERSWPLNAALSLGAGAASGAALWLVMRAVRSNQVFQPTVFGGS
jgi:hypothetical protein